MNRVVHFEIHASQPDVLVQFYTQLFNWTAQQWGNMPYFLLMTGAEDGHRGINGAILQRQGAHAPIGAPVNAFICTVQVDDVDAMMARGTGMGATVALDATDYPGMGRVGYLLDPEANLFGLMRPEA